MILFSKMKIGQKYFCLENIAIYNFDGISEHVLCHRFCLKKETISLTFRSCGFNFTVVCIKSKQINQK